MTKKVARMLDVVGPRIKVKVSGPKETRSAGGIIVSTDIKSAEDQEEGVVVQLGHCAYGNFSKNWCEVGDTVLFQRYAGKPREEMDENGNLGYYRTLRDIDVIAVVREVEIKETQENKETKEATNVQ